MSRYEIENKRIILRIKRGFDLHQTLMELAKREVRLNAKNGFIAEAVPWFLLYEKLLFVLTQCLDTSLNGRVRSKQRTDSTVNPKALYSTWQLFGV